MIKTLSISNVGSNSTQVVYALLFLLLSLAAIKSNALAQSLAAVSQHGVSQSASAASSHEVGLSEKLTVLQERLKAFDNLTHSGTPLHDQPLVTVNDSASIESTGMSLSTMNPIGSIAASTTVSSMASSKNISNMLLESIASLLQTMNTESQDREAINPNGDGSASEVVKFVNEKIESLERMIKLMEQKREIEAARNVYQKRLNDLQKKIEDSGMAANSVAQK